jgi:hypothetical protein
MGHNKNKISFPGSRWPAARELQKVLDLPARSRFGEGRAVPFYRQLLTIKNLNHFPLLAKPCDLCPSKIAILKLWRYLRLTEGEMPPTKERTILD